MRRRLLLALVPLAPLPLLAGACSDIPARLGVIMRSPQGLLDQATAVELSVFDVGDAECNDDGSISGRRSPGAQTFQLDDSGCADGVTWCKTIELDRDDATKMFEVIATSPAGTLAQGCATAAIDQDPLEVTIKVQRFIAPKCCNNGVLEAGEQCDSGAVADPSCDQSPAGECKGIVADEVCECDCTAREILLSIDNTAEPMLVNGAPGTKSALALAFAPGAPPRDQALRAVFVNTGDDARGAADINQRFLKPDLFAFGAELFPLSQQLRLPVECSSVQGSLGVLQRQSSPSIAAIGNTTAIVYSSDELLGGAFDVFLVPQTLDGCVDTHSCQDDTECQTGACDLSSGSCAPAARISNSLSAPGVSSPDVAGGPPDAGLVVWTAANQVFGRIWRTDGTLAPATQILIAQNGASPRVAGNAKGWWVVYQGVGGGDADGVFLRTVDLNGTPGGEQRVNLVTGGLQDQPDVALLPDGRAAIVWHHAGDVYFQRYAATGVPLPDDQAAPLNTVLDGDQQRPVVAASVGSGEFFAVAWETIETATISGRFLGASGGFGYNSVSGQNDEFLATNPALVDGSRHNPAIAIGGGGYVVIGWEDTSPTHPGVFVRRFPLPQ
jgi:hypothetical protein